MERAILLTKIYWNLQATWPLRRRSASDEPSIKETVKGLQTLLLDPQGAMLERTLCQVFARPGVLPGLSRLDIALYQEGAEQRVWRARATLEDGTRRAFGIIVARAPGVSSVLTQRDFGHLQALHTHHGRYCVMPYVCGMLPVAGGLAAYTVEWLDEHKELVFEIAYDAGVFLVNAQGAHRRFSPQESRQIWRRIGGILWWYPGLRRVNIQAGDFVGRVGADGQIELKLTTARELLPEVTPAECIHTLLRSVITASGYLSNGRQPFDRHMSQAVFLHRMQAVLQRRFGDQARPLARQQWRLFQQGAFAQQEDWLKEDCVLATYDRLRADYPVSLAWYETRQRWTAYANAVQAGHLPPSWWFPAADIPLVLDRLVTQHVS
ncbi:MAG TPA: hypothetical protein VIH59_17580 [Candidatus Tectomicrobia bacterium]